MINEQLTTSGNFTITLKVIKKSDNYKLKITTLKTYF